jgi:hypothetical protein
MASVYSTRTCLPKFCCSILAIGLFTAGILLTGAYPHPDLDDHGSHPKNQTNTSTDTANHTSTGNSTLAAERLAFIQASNEALYAHLDKALARIQRNVQQNQELAKRIAMFTQNNPEPEYQMSEYATGTRRWRRAPSVHPIPITYLLEYEVRNKHNQNKILGDKVAQILHQNTDLSDKIAEEYQTPSEKLKKDPIMALVMKMVSTYMLIRHSKNGKATPKAEDFSSWGEPFFKKKE